MSENSEHDAPLSWTERMSARDRLEETRIRLVIEYLVFPGVICLVWLLVGGAYVVGPLDAATDPGRFRVHMAVAGGLSVLLLGLQWRNLRDLRKREKELLGQREAEGEGRG